MLQGGLRIVIILLAALVPGALLAQEVIRSFDTAIALAVDGSVTITETITVNATGNQIRRGIFRDVPTVLATDNGGRLYQELTVLSVTRDGRAEPYELEAITNGQRIRIGDGDTLLTRGQHVYAITYRMDRAARYFADYDELYWNATGNFWQFPIEAATATVTLPEGAGIVDLAVGTGRQGASGSNAVVQRLSPTSVRFVTKETLAPYEGMTFAIALRKGVLAEPAGLAATGHWLSDNRHIIVPLIALVLVLAYNGLAWNAVGRDPARGAIFPRFHPPAGYSPALVHYIHNYGWRNSGWLAFSAALVSLATKGLVDLTMEDKTNTITRTARAPEGKLPPGEAVILGYLDRQRSVTIDKSTGPALNTERGRFIRAIEAENRGVYFSHNFLFVIGGVLLGAAVLGLMVLLGILAPEVVLIAFFAAVAIFVAGTVLRSLLSGGGIGRFFALFGIGVVLLNTVGMALTFASSLNIDFPITAAVTIVLVTAIFGILMRAPTVHGRKVMDEIDGFRMYLDTAEKERLNFSGEPEMTTKRFESILPFAMALGVEKPWSERFENDLARNAVADAAPGYHPYWYHGSGFRPNAFASSMSSIAGGLSAAMVSAQPAQSSSSGFSGGGFSSGGGGGGGGGGGW